MKLFPARMFQDDSAAIRLPLMADAPFTHDKLWQVWE